MRESEHGRSAADLAGPLRRSHLSKYAELVAAKQDLLVASRLIDLVTAEVGIARPSVAALHTEDEIMSFKTSKGDSYQLWRT